MSKIIKLPTLISYEKENDDWFTELITDEEVISMWYGDDTAYIEKSPFLYRKECRFVADKIESYYETEVIGLSYISTVVGGKAIVGMSCEQLDELLNDRG